MEECSHVTNPVALLFHYASLFSTSLDPYNSLYKPVHDFDVNSVLPKKKGRVATISCRIDTCKVQWPPHLLDLRCRCICSNSHTLSIDIFFQVFFFFFYRDHFWLFAYVLLKKIQFITMKRCLVYLYAYAYLSYIHNVQKISMHTDMPVLFIPSCM